MARPEREVSKPIKIRKVIGHLCTYVLSVFLIIWSGESPRVLLYAHGISLIYKLIAVWFFAVALEVNGAKGVLGKRFTREPRKSERSKPWKDSRTREPAGIVGYIFAILTLLFMVGVVLSMGSGTGFLALQVIVSEVNWALLVALIYLFDDFISKQLVISSEKNVTQNLGYNIGGLNFLMAAVFISAFVLLIAMNITPWLFRGPRFALHAEWVILLVLGLIRLVYDIRRDRSE